MKRLVAFTLIGIVLLALLWFSVPSLFSTPTQTQVVLAPPPTSTPAHEVRDAKQRYSLASVYFHDETFALDPAWTADFCDSYRRAVGLPFSCQVRADTVTDPLVRALAEAGCRTVSFGIESGNAGQRRDALGKAVSDEQIVSCAELLRRHGIRFRTYNILGFPGETIEQAYETVALNRRIATDYPWCSLLQPLPGTDLCAEVEDRLLTHDYDLFDFLHTQLPTTLPLKEFFKECEGLYRHAVPPGRQLSLLRKYRLGDVPGLVVKGRRE